MFVLATYRPKFCTYEVVLDVGEVDLSDALLEFQRILNEADASMDVVLETVNIRSQVASLTNTQ